MPIAEILALLQAALAILPQAAQAVPIVESMIAGNVPSAADIATLLSVKAALDAQAATAEAAAGATGPTA